MSAPFFSVLVPVYNQENYIRQCLDSILAQDFSDYELIIVDDGSTDASAKICDDYQKEHPEKITVFHKENEGLILARKTALSFAKGEYILHVDSDDYIHEGLFSSVARAFEEQQVDAVFFNAGVNDSRENFFSVPCEANQVVSGEALEDLKKQIVATNCFNSVWSKCFKHSAYREDIIYDGANQVSMGEDVYQILPLLDEVGSVYYLDRVFYAYRVNDNSMTHKWRDEYYVSLKAVAKRRMEYAAKWKLDEALLDETFGNNCYVCMDSILRASNLSQKEVIAKAKQMRKDEFYKKYRKYYLPKVSSKMRLIFGLLEINVAVAVILSRTFEKLRGNL